MNADYVRQALDNRFSLRLTTHIGVEEYQSRMLAACRVYSVAASLGDLKGARKTWLLLSFKEVQLGDSDLQAAQSEAGVVLSGKVYAARLCRIVPVVKPKINARTDRMPLVDDSRFFVSPGSIMVLSKRAGDPRFGASRSEP